MERIKNQMYVNSPYDLASDLDDAYRNGVDMVIENIGVCESCHEMFLKDSDFIVCECCRENEPETVSCPNCEMLMINGYATHETGCVTSYLFVPQECKYCGCAFFIDEGDAKTAFCSEDCTINYNT
jgi:hypothetical protein